MTRSRRELLRMIAAGATVPALSSLMQACGGPTNAVTRGNTTHERPLLDIQDQLRAAVTRLSGKFKTATALVVRNRRGRAVVDDTEKAVDTQTFTSLIFAGVSDHGRFERGTTDLSKAGIDLAELQLRQRSKSPVAKTRSVSGPIATQRFATKVGVDPRKLTPQDWLHRLEQLLIRSRTVGDSRIVHRGAYLLVDDSETVFVAPQRELSQRLVRTRAGVELIAWTGNQPNFDEASRAGTLGLEAMDIKTSAMDAAAARVLSLLTARGAQNFDTTVVLEPSVVALLVQHCVGPTLRGDRWLSGAIDGVSRVGKKIASEAVTIIDDPTAKGLYGSYFFDDEGHKARPATLVDRGVLRGPLTDSSSAAQLKLPHTASSRRPVQLDFAHPQFSNLFFAPGKRTRAELISAVDSGVLVEGGLRAQFDPRTWRFVVRAARAREIRKGTLTGKLFAGVDMVGDLPALLANVTGMSNRVEHRSTSNVRLPATAGGPYMLTRAKLVGRG